MSSSNISGYNLRCWPGRGNTVALFQDRDLPMGKPAKIVVVEDDASMSQAIERILRAGGFTAILFDSAEAALASDQSAPADCLILDIQLPGKSGIELFRQLTLLGKEAPAIFITAHDEPRTRIEVERLGATRFLTKPFSGRALLNAIEEAIGGKQD